MKCEGCEMDEAIRYYHTGKHLCAQCFSTAIKQEISERKQQMRDDAGIFDDTPFQPIAAAGEGE